MPTERGITRATKGVEIIRISGSKKASTKHPKGPRTSGLRPSKQPR